MDILKNVNSGNLKLHAVHVGISGFPFGSASVSKCLAVYECLFQHNVEFTIINNRPVHQESVLGKIEKEGLINGLKYVYTTQSPYKSKSIINRKLVEIKGRINEFGLLWKLCRNKKAMVIFYYPTNGSFIELIFYRVFSKWFRIPLIAHYVEYRSAFNSWLRPIERFFDTLFDLYFFYFVDAILPISEFLINHLNKRGCKKPYIKIPPLTDFRLFKTTSRVEGENYFLYVGTAVYRKAITFILTSFENMKNDLYSLVMVVNGKPYDLETLHNQIQKMSKKNQVKVLSNLSYPELIQKYVNASALLIPLSDSIPDQARFPQKISEYLASGNPIITTNKGEIKFYFQNEVNALIAEANEVELFSERMDFVTKHKEISKKIGEAGYQTGLCYFDLSSHGTKLRSLVENLIDNYKR